MSGRAWSAIGLGLLWVLVTAGASRAQSISATITSEVLGTDRTIYVRLPAGYDLSSDSYPVLYLTDGQSIDWMAPHVDSLAGAGSVPEMIIVAIPHPNRRSDLTPTHLDEMARSGGGERFLRFIADELIPYIDAVYRTDPTRLLFGHSLGGLFVAYALVNEPGLFAAFISSSAVLSWDHSYVLGLAAEALAGPTDWQTFFFMGVGSDDMRSSIASTRELSAWLEENAPDGLRWTYRVYEGEDHGSMHSVGLMSGLVEFFQPPGG